MYEIMSSSSRRPHCRRPLTSSVTEPPLQSCERRGQQSAEETKRKQIMIKKKSPLLTDTFNNIRDFRFVGGECWGHTSQCSGLNSSFMFRDHTYLSVLRVLDGMQESTQVHCLEGKTLINPCTASPALICVCLFSRTDLTNLFIARCSLGLLYSTVNPNFNCFRQSM